MTLEVNINKKLKGFHLDVSFIQSGRCMGILGASGCGKSMTLKCIAGIERPDHGIIRLGDRTLFDSEKGIHLKPQIRKVGYLFQNYALFPNMTVEGNIGIGIFGGNIKSKGNTPSILVSGQKKQNEIIQEYISRFHLNGLEKRYPAELSGGQQQRVALARILANQPDMILLDEPFSALDSFLKDSLQQELLEIIKDYPSHVIIVSHDRDEIYKFCDSLTCMDAGKQLLTGSTKDIFTNPRRMEVARLTGCKNISPIRKINDYELFALDWDVTLETDTPIDDTIRFLGIRAHDLRILDDPSLEDDTTRNTHTNRNRIPIQSIAVSETPFEYEYLLKNTNNCNTKNIWYKSSKHRDSPLNLSKDSTLIFPKKSLMLLT